MPGVVSLPHGWGHNAEGARLRVARAHAGVNTNVLTDNRAYDAASGTAVCCRKRSSCASPAGARDPSKACS